MKALYKIPTMGAIVHTLQLGCTTPLVIDGYHITDTMVYEDENSVATAYFKDTPTPYERDASALILIVPYIRFYEGNLVGVEKMLYELDAISEEIWRVFRSDAPVCIVTQWCSDEAARHLFNTTKVSVIATAQKVYWRSEQ